jgi:nucleotide-binding universal stress UspA family protein
MPALRNILVPIDGSTPSVAALDHAVALAEDGDASIHVLHVEAPDEFEVGSMTPLSADARTEIGRAMDEAVERAREHLEDRVSFRTIPGDPLREIVNMASEGAFDLVVIGTHGRAGRLRSLLGSVAEGVVRNAPCPVLTVREPGGEYQSFAERRHGRPSFSGREPRHPT